VITFVVLKLGTFWKVDHT